MANIWNTMTHTQKFIEDAIKGGWTWRGETGEQPSELALPHVLLDPLAWQAVGMTSGWSDAGWDKYATQAIFNWHRFIDHLADGLSIEEALGKL